VALQDLATLTHQLVVVLSTWGGGQGAGAGGQGQGGRGIREGVY
jgi:hypothetical protein